MKKRFLVLALLLVSVTFIAAPASAFLTNWGFDPDGGGDSIIEIGEYLNLEGLALIQNNFSDFTFSETGVFSSDSYGPNSTFTGPPSLSLGTDLYATFEATGTLTTGAFLFDAVPDALKIYDYYGGTLIGTFSLLSGGGLLDDSFGPASNGLITANLVAQELAYGYWFTDSTGTQDLADWTLSKASPILALGFATTNASIVDPPTPVVDSNGRLVEFTVSNNGQFRLDVDVVPEPGTMILMGIGLIGIAGFGRKKMLKK